MALATRPGKDVHTRTMRIMQLLAEVAGNEPASRIDLVLHDEVEGTRTATVLAAVAERTWGTALDLDKVWVHGFESVTEQDLHDAIDDGHRWRLVASATPHCARVEPTRIPIGSPLAHDYRADVVQVHLVRGGTITLHASTPRERP